MEKLNILEFFAMELKKWIDFNGKKWTNYLFCWILNGKVNEYVNGYMEM